MAGRFWAASSVGLALLLGGCSTLIGAYHNVEGGAISQNRQPPPGMDLPYPNLADVPPAPQPGPAPATQQASITAQAHGGVSAPSPGALAGLTLPESVPPLPNVPGINIPATPTPSPGLSATAAPAPAPAPRPPAPPVAIGFVPGKALLTFNENRKVAALAASAGDASVIAGGFGEGSLTLALSRARRLADALTAAGVPAGHIRLVAAQAGSGGFVQLVY
jgi:hypothetical protein